MRRPQAGLFTAIIGGFLVSALGGSRFQIGGPAGAFIVLVASIIDAHGMAGLMLATMMAGAIMVVGALLRLGSLVRHVPHAVTVGILIAGRLEAHFARGNRAKRTDRARFVRAHA